MIRQVVRAGVPYVAAALWLNLLLVLPNYPNAMEWDALLVFPLELPAILLALIAIPNGRTQSVFRVLLVLALTVICTLKIVDLVTFNALSRPFNPVSDLPLIEAFVRLIAGTVGPLLTALAVCAAIGALLGIAALSWWATGVWGRISIFAPVGFNVGLVSMVIAAIAVADTAHVLKAWTLPTNPPGSAFTMRLGVQKYLRAQRTIAELRVFRSAVREDPFSGQAGLLNAIDRDVIVIFVESYGRTSLDKPFYADLHRATLSDYASKFNAAGLSMRSGVLLSPTKGGQSWLAHSTVSNGLWIDNQIRYAAALSSGRETLFHHAARNGFHTATVMPQITLDWPESARMGFDVVLPANALGYKGRAFNWVTMPDQFALAALDRLVRNGTQTKRQFIQVALASSHAPWVPVAKILPWDEIGDGTVYNPIVEAGEAPEVVWRDRQRVREQYRLSVDYSLQSVMEYVLLHAKDPPLILVIGDHQAAEVIAQDDRSDVPLHVIGPAHLVERLKHIAPFPGLLPADDAEPLPMDHVRDAVLTAFTDTKTSEVGQ